MFKKIFLTHFFLLLFINSVCAESVKKINVIGNERISSDTIVIFGEIDLNEDFPNSNQSFTIELTQQCVGPDWFYPAAN